MKRHDFHLLFRSVSAAGFLLVSNADAAPLESQTLTLKAGWNAVYVEVAPTAPLDEVFAG